MAFAGLKQNIAPLAWRHGESSRHRVGW